MNDELVKELNNQTFNKSAILKIKYYNPPDIILQHLPVKEEVIAKQEKHSFSNKTEINRLRNGYIIDTLTSVDIQEIVKIGGKIIQIYEGVIYRENFKTPPFRKFINELFDLRNKYKDEGNDILQNLVKLIMNSIYGQTIRKDIEEEYFV